MSSLGPRTLLVSYLHVVLVVAIYLKKYEKANFVSVFETDYRHSLPVVLHVFPYLLRPAICVTLGLWTVLKLVTPSSAGTAWNRLRRYLPREPQVFVIAHLAWFLSTIEPMLNTDQYSCYVTRLDQATPDLTWPQTIGYYLVKSSYAPIFYYGVIITRTVLSNCNVMHNKRSRRVIAGILILTFAYTFLVYWFLFESKHPEKIGTVSTFVFILFTPVLVYEMQATRQMRVFLLGGLFTSSSIVCQEVLRYRLLERNLNLVSSGHIVVLLYLCEHMDKDGLDLYLHTYKRLPKYFPFPNRIASIIALLAISKLLLLYNSLELLYKSLTYWTQLDINTHVFTVDFLQHLIHFIVLHYKYIIPHLAFIVDILFISYVFKISGIWTPFYRILPGSYNIRYVFESWKTDTEKKILRAWIITMFYIFATYGLGLGVNFVLLDFVIMEVCIITIRFGLTVPDSYEEEIGEDFTFTAFLFPDLATKMEDPITGEIAEDRDAVSSDDADDTTDADDSLHVQPSEKQFEEKATQTKMARPRRISQRSRRLKKRQVVENSQVKIGNVFNYVFRGGYIQIGNQNAMEVYRSCDD